MRFSWTNVVGFSAGEVFRRAAQDLNLLEGALPNVKRLETLSSRMLSADVLERVDRWVAGSDRRVAGVNITQATWVVTSRWNFRQHRATWTIDVEQPRNGAACSGSFSVCPRVDDACSVTIEGDLRVTGRGLPGPLRAFAIAVAPMVESVLVSMLENNLEALTEGVEDLLKAHLSRAC